MKIVKHITMALSTCFYLGYLPASGTFASLAGIALFYLIRESLLLYFLVISILILGGIFLSTAAEKITGKKDPGCIVIDEVAGMLISLVFLPFDLRLVVLAFIIFRILDVFKPFPADRLQALPGGLGVMSDDIVAGIYTNIILQVVLRAASFRGA